MWKDSIVFRENWMNGYSYVFEPQTSNKEIFQRNVKRLLRPLLIFKTVCGTTTKWRHLWKWRYFWHALDESWIYSYYVIFDRQTRLFHRPRLFQMDPRRDVLSVFFHSLFIKTDNFHNNSQFAKTLTNSKTNRKFQESKQTKGKKYISRSQQQTVTQSDQKWAP